LSYKLIVTSLLNVKKTKVYKYACRIFSRETCVLILYSCILVRQVMLFWLSAFLSSSSYFFFFCLLLLIIIVRIPCFFFFLLDFLSWAAKSLLFVLFKKYIYIYIILCFLYLAYDSSMSFIVSFLFPFFLPSYSFYKEIYFP